MRSKWYSIWSKFLLLVLLCSTGRVCAVRELRFQIFHIYYRIPSLLSELAKSDYIRKKQMVKNAMDMFCRIVNFIREVWRKKKFKLNIGQRSANKHKWPMVEISLKRWSSRQDLNELALRLGILRETQRSYLKKF
jgi:hypothetical protein